MSLLEIVAAALALLYVLLAMFQNRLCWVAAFVSALCYLVIFAEVKLYMESGLQLIYASMAVLGWYFWGGDKENQLKLPVSTRPLIFHVSMCSGIAVVAVSVGALLTTLTDAARPFLDSATTVAAIACTWMVTRKILENWLYWIVINAVSVWLFMDRGLDLTSGLYALYILLSFAGYLAWRRSMYASVE